MRRRATASALVVVIVAGAAAAYRLVWNGFDGEEGRAPHVEAHETGEAARLSSDEAERHRAEDYIGLDTLAAVRRLPTSFSRAEALHRLAGRSDVPALRRMIAGTARIDSERERTLLLEILLTRLTELDPAAAVVELGTVPAGVRRRLTFAVFGAWAETDVDAAIAAVNALRDGELQHDAAEALLWSKAGGDMRQVERLLGQLEIAGDESHLRNLALRTLAGRDPRAALQYAMALPSARERRDAASWIAWTWGSTDPAAALAAAARIADPVVRGAFEQSAFGQWLQQAPEAALDWVLDQASGRGRRGMLSRAIEAVAGRDPRLALARAGALPPGEREEALAAAVQGYARQDPRAALSWLSTQPDGLLKSSLQSVFAAAYAEQLPEEAFAWAQGVDAVQGSDLATQVLSVIASADAQHALSVALTLDGHRQARAIARVLGSLAQEDPTAAAGYLQVLPYGEERWQAASIVAHRWAAEDAEAAFAWALELDGPIRDRALQAIAHQTAAHSPETAARMLERLSGGARVEFAKNSVSGLDGTEATMGWLSQFSREAFYPEVLGAVLQKLAYTDPAAALQRLDEVRDARQRTVIAVSAGATLAERNPAEAARWAASLSDRPLRTSAISTVFSQWRRYDPAAAENWGLSLAPGPARDSVLREMAIDPGASFNEAVELIGQIQSPGDRDLTVLSVYGRLLQQDPVLAERLLASFPLDPDRERAFRKTGLWPD